MKGIISINTGNRIMDIQDLIPCYEAAKKLGINNFDMDRLIIDNEIETEPITRGVEGLTLADFETLKKLIKTPTSKPASFFDEGDDDGEPEVSEPTPVTVSAPKPDKARELIDKINAASTKSIIEIGGYLKQLKDAVGHGNWLPTLQREWGWSEDKATKYIRAHSP